ncbi:MAG: succinylglutamate desuccinylase/aspartoacylase family protein, partial [Halobacteriaceae archaeon]
FLVLKRIDMAEDVIFGEDDEDGYRSKDEAEKLANELDDLVQSYGLPIVNEYEAEEYVEQNLQRSTAGAVLNNAGIPAFTIELGSHTIINDDLVSAGVAGNYRVMEELGMLEKYPEFGPSNTSFQSPVDFPVRRNVGPHTDTPGIARHQIAPGDVFNEGDIIANIVTPHGKHKSNVRAEHDGYVLGRSSGVACYENDSLLMSAVRDEGDLVVPRDPDK